jgi:hypothetical protein
MGYQEGPFLTTTLASEQRKYSLSDKLQMSARRLAPLTTILVGEFRKVKKGDAEYKTLGDREPTMSGVLTGSSGGAAATLTTTIAEIRIVGGGNYLKVGDVIAVDKYATNNSNTNKQSHPENMRITSVIDTNTFGVTRNIEAVGTSTYNVSNSAAGNTLPWQLLSSAMAENADPRNAKQYSVYSDKNYIQSEQETFEISDIQEMTDHFGPDELTRNQKIALVLLNRKVESALLYGVRSENFVDGKPLRTTGGALWHLDRAVSDLSTQAYAAAYDLVTGDNSSRIWRPGGEFNANRFEKFVTETFIMGSDTRLGVHGKDFLRILKAEYENQIRLERKETTYGVTVNEYETQGKLIRFVEDPEMDVMGPRDLLCFDLDNIEFNHMKDIHKRSIASERGKKGEWLTYFGFSMHAQNTHSAILGMDDIAL